MNERKEPDKRVRRRLAAVEEDLKLRPFRPLDEYLASESYILKGVYYIPFGPAPESELDYTPP